MSAATEPRYTWYDFEEDNSTDAIPGKEILTIADSGEEMAVIVHRNVPTLHNERIKDAKREWAQRIVDALNAYEKGERTMSDPWPYIVRWPDGSTDARYSDVYAAEIKAQSIGGSYNYEPRGNA